MTGDLARRDRVLVDARGLAAALAGDRPPVVLDVRWALGVTDGREQHRAAHVPGAVYVDLETELAGPPSPAAGRHPLPEPGALQAAARRWGVRADRGVVVYDALGGTSAARAWWLLRWAGHDDVRLLDGGLPAWRAAGYPTEEGDVRPEPGTSSSPRAGCRCSTPTTRPGSRRRACCSTRAGERYRGEVEPVDPRAGHVPGAVSAPTTGNLAADGTFLAPDALGARFAALGVDPSSRVGVYCGSGVTAAHEVAALATLGVDAALYAGSWSQWSNDPDRPVAT